MSSAARPSRGRAQGKCNSGQDEWSEAKWRHDTGSVMPRSADPPHVE